MAYWRKTLSVLALSAFSMIQSGCVTDSGAADGGTGPEFMSGHYYIQSDADDIYGNLSNTVTDWEIPRTCAKSPGRAATIHERTPL